MGADLVTIVRRFRIEPSKTFTSTSPDVLDECISPGTYRLLRFDFLSHNAGNTDLQFGAPPPPPPYELPPGSPWVWSTGHGHYHLRDFNEYSLLDMSDREVRPGLKQAFCLMDVERTNPNAPRPFGFYTCSNQGVSTGWSDVYSSSLPCQYIPIDGVPDGEYRLLASTNVSRVAREDRYDNNSVIVGLRIQGNNPPSEVAPYWSGPNHLSGPLVQPGISPAAWRPNRLVVFGVNTDGKLYRMAWDGYNWQGWNGLTTPVPAGTALQSPVSTVPSWGSRRIDVFGVRTDGALFHAAYDPLTWSLLPVPRLSGSGFQAPVSAVSWASRGGMRLDVFGVKTDGKLHHMAFNGSSWSGPNPLSGISFAPPVSAVAWGPNRLDVFGVSTDSGLHHMAFNGSSWSGSNTFALSGFKSPVSVVSRGPNLLDLFAVDLNGALHWMVFDGSTWSRWLLSRATVYRTPVSAVAWGPKRLDVFALAANGLLYHMPMDGSTWSGPNHPGGFSFQSPVSAVSWAANRLDVFGIGTDKALYQMRYR
ncbi:lysyl oxidase family protein [Streptomyces sp. NPDC101206]|uniref:lysyl oxidase family protein n=1 Tax=Streptomyces sp. NPDC101206 TaxID=3366128 RepID=UPI003818DAF7